MINFEIESISVYIFLRIFLLRSTCSNSDIFKILWNRKWTRIYFLEVTYWCQHGQIQISLRFICFWLLNLKNVHLSTWHDKAGVIDKDLIFCWLLLIDIYMPLFCIELFIYNTWCIQGLIYFFLGNCSLWNCKHVYQI